VGLLVGVIWLAVVAFDPRLNAFPVLAPPPNILEFWPCPADASAGLLGVENPEKASDGAAVLAVCGELAWA